jgi:hypothetical protein
VMEPTMLPVSWACSAAGKRAKRMSKRKRFMRRPQK